MSLIIDTREQKSPQFLVDEFDATILKLEVGDILYKDAERMELTELKLYKDFGIHTEQLERFAHELYRMNKWCMEGENRDIHAIWMTPTYNKHEFDMFHHYCHNYYCRGHIVMNEGQLISRLKKIMKGQYKRMAPAIKRIHQPVSTWVKMLAQFPKLSLEKALEIEKVWAYPDDIYPDLKEEIEFAQLNLLSDHVFGRKKNRMPKKITEDFLKFWFGRA